MKPQLFITLLSLISSINVASADMQAIYDAHIAWKTAFEGVDIAARKMAGRRFRRRFF